LPTLNAAFKGNRLRKGFCPFLKQVFEDGLDIGAVIAMNQIQKIFVVAIRFLTKQFRWRKKMLGLTKILRRYFGRSIKLKGWNDYIGLLLIRSILMNT
jgi:hypothetical protein